MRIIIDNNTGEVPLTREYDTLVGLQVITLLISLAKYVRHGIAMRSSTYGIITS